MVRVSSFQWVEIEANLSLLPFLPEVGTTGTVQVCKVSPAVGVKNEPTPGTPDCLRMRDRHGHLVELGRERGMPRRKANDERRPP